MALRVTEFTFLEQFASRYGIPVPRHIPGTAKIAEIRNTIEEWGGEAIVKPDIISGERGRAGSVVRVTNIQEAVREIKRISSLEIKGKMPRIAYLVEISFILEAIKIYVEEGEGTFIFIDECKRRAGNLFGGESHPLRQSPNQGRLPRTQLPFEGNDIPRDQHCSQ